MKNAFLVVLGALVLVLAGVVYVQQQEIATLDHALNEAGDNMRALIAPPDGAFSIAVPYDDTPVLLGRTHVFVDGKTVTLACGVVKFVMYDSYDTEATLWLGDKLVAKLETPMSRLVSYDGHKTR